MEVLLGRESNWRSAPFASGEAVMPQGGVTTGWWYEPAMNSKDGQLGVAAGASRVSADQLGFQRREEALGYRIVPRCAGSANALGNLMRHEKLAVCPTRTLTAGLSVTDQSRCRLACHQHYLERA